MLDTPAEPGFDELVGRRRCWFAGTDCAGQPGDEERQWFKGSGGPDGRVRTAAEQAFCAHAILGSDVLEVRDAMPTRALPTTPLVTGDPGIQFYAGAPIQLADGSRVGTLCVIDRSYRVRWDALSARSAAAAQPRGVRSSAGAAP